jgi:hypothetical protein
VDFEWGMWRRAVSSNEGGIVPRWDFLGREVVELFFFVGLIEVGL